MKPTVTRVASVPRTALVCCPECYQLISYEVGQASITCHTCGITVIGQTLPTSLESSVNPD